MTASTKFWRKYVCQGASRRESLEWSWRLKSPEKDGVWRVLRLEEGEERGIECRSISLRRWTYSKNNGKRIDRLVGVANICHNDPVIVGNMDSGQFKERME